MLVLGIDGADYNLIVRLMNEGRLRNFLELKEGGAFGPLRTTPYAHSAPAWTSIYTGVNPGKHGIFDFLDPRTGAPVSALSRREPALWNVLDLYGKRSIVINAPLTYPVDRINGVMISGFPLPEGAEDWVHPPSLKGWLLEMGYLKLLQGIKLEGKRPESDKDTLRRALKEVRTVTSLARHFLREEWDLFFVVFRALDIVQHFFWHLKDVVIITYELFDRLIGALLNVLDDDTALIVISDHGFKRLQYYFYLNEWLRLKGFIRSHPPLVRKVINVGLANLVTTLPPYLFYAGRLLRLYKLSPLLSRKRGRKVQALDVKPGLSGLASLAVGGIKVTAKGGMYRKVRERLRRELREIRALTARR